MPIDYKDYPRNWKTEIVPAIRKRSGDCCEECGLKNGIVITRHKDGTWSEAGGKDWVMINDRVKATGCTVAKSMKYFKFFRVVLTTAHWDHDKKNSSYHSTDKDAPENNLFHWCQKCHLWHDRDLHDRNRKYGRKWKENQLTIKFEEL